MPRVRVGPRSCAFRLDEAVAERVQAGDWSTGARVVPDVTEADGAGPALAQRVGADALTEVTRAGLSFAADEVTARRFVLVAIEALAEAGDQGAAAAVGAVGVDGGGVLSAVDEPFGGLGERSEVGHGCGEDVCVADQQHLVCEDASQVVDGGAAVGESREGADAAGLEVLVRSADLVLQHGPHVGGDRDAGEVARRADVAGAGGESVALGLASVAALASDLLVLDLFGGWGEDPEPALPCLGERVDNPARVVTSSMTATRSSRSCPTSRSSGTRWCGAGKGWSQRKFRVIGDGGEVGRDLVGELRPERGVGAVLRSGPLGEGTDVGVGDLGCLLLEADRGRGGGVGLGEVVLQERLDRLGAHREPPWSRPRERCAERRSRTRRSCSTSWAS